MNTKTRLGLGFGGQILLAAILGIYVLFGLTDVKQHFGFVIEHDAPVIANARYLSKLVVDMETGQRGFCIVQKEEFLAPYNAGVRNFRTLMEKEKKLVSDNPGQVEALEQIEHLVHEWQDKAAKPEIEMARKTAMHTIDAHKLQDILKRGVGKELIDKFMALGHEIEFSFSDRRDWEGAFAVKTIEKCMADMEDSQRGFLITGKEEFLDKYTTGKQKSPEYFARLRTMVSARGRDDELSKKIDRLELLSYEWTEKAAESEIAARREMNENSTTPRDVASLLETGTGKSLIDEVRKKLDRFIEIEEELTILRYDHATKTSVKTGIITVTLLVFALCFGVIIALATSRAISNPLVKLARGAERVGSGDLDTQVDIKSSDEIGFLSRAFNDMARRLQEASSMRDQSEAALLESKENLSITLNSIGDAVIATDNEGRVTRMNPIAEKLTGWSLSNAKGHPLSEVFNIINEKTRKKVESPVERVIREGGIVGLANHTILISKDGPEFPIDDSGAPIRNAKGDIAGVVLVFRDISESKEAKDALRESEERLQQSQKMESIGTLAGGIAHDFNNILFPIVGNTEMLLEDIPEDSPLRDNLNEVFSGAMRAKELVKQILAFSRQDSHEIKLIRIQPIIKDALKLIRSTIPTSIEIKQTLSHDCGAIKGDPTQIHQIVMNLATNAYHAMEDTGGELKVNLKEIELGEQDLPSPDMEPGPYACLIVADSGTGIDDNVIERIFDPYFTTKELGKGTGMGLSVVHGIVKKAGGSIHLYSKFGQGAEFHVYLPVVRNSYGKQKAQTKDPIQRGTEQILLVDDEDAIVSMEKQMLERLGYNVVSRTSSIEALEAFRENPDKFDLAITDMAMPNMSGDKLASELLKLRPGLPILLCTGFSEKIPEEKAKSIGIKGFLMKPIVMTELANMIRGVLDNKENYSKG